MFVPVPSQDLDFQHHMSLSFLYLISGGETFLLTLAEVLTITI